MIRLNVHDAKTHLSRYLRRLEQGETILLSRHNRPIAEIRPISESENKPRAFGLDEGKIVLSPDFFEPWDTETLGYFGCERNCRMKSGRRVNRLRTNST